MKKLFKLFLLCTALAFAIGLAACADRLGHEHDWKWAYDENIHWQKCDGCDQTQGIGTHDYNEGVCLICGYVDPTYVPPHSHTYGEWQISVPTESAEGSAVKTCSTCSEDGEGHTVTVTLPVLGDPGYQKTSDMSTCTEGCEVGYSITIDGEVIIFLITMPARGHLLKLHGAIAGDCTTDGITAYWECLRCVKYFSDEDGTNEIERDSWIIPAPVHTLKKHAKVSPTCIKSGNDEYWECEVCGKYFYEWNDRFIETNWNTFIIPAAGHELHAHEEVPVDCETPGIRAYWECMVCRKFFSDKCAATEIDRSSLVIPAPGHPFYVRWEPDRYFGHFRYSSCKHQIFEEKPHRYVDGACETCGYEQPKVYFDEDAPNGQSGYIIIYKYGYNSEYADIYLPYLLGQTDPDDAYMTWPEKFFETECDEQYGTGWQTEIYENRTHYILNFFCDFEKGNTFKIKSLSRRYDFTSSIDENNNFLVYLYQNIHKTQFCDINVLTNAALYKTNAGGSDREYLTALRAEYHVNEGYIYWYCALEEGETVERIFRIDVTFDENGIMYSATVSHVHTYKDWEITADYHARYPTCEHYSEIEIGDHEYVEGVCKVCGFKQPKVFTDEDGTGATIFTFEIDGKKIVRFSLDHIRDESGLMFGNDKLAEDVVKTGDDPVYGELYETTLLRMSASYRLERLFRIRFYWNISGGTFRLYSVDRYIELFSFSDDFGKNFGVALYQTYYETSFSSKMFTLSDCRLYVESSDQYTYLAPANVEYLENARGFIWTVSEQVDGQTVETVYHVTVNACLNGFVGTFKVTKEA